MLASVPVGEAPYTVAIANISPMIRIINTSIEIRNRIDACASIQIITGETSLFLCKSAAIIITSVLRNN